MILGFFISREILFWKHKKRSDATEEDLYVIISYLIHNDMLAPKIRDLQNDEKSEWFNYYIAGVPFHEYTICRKYISSVNYNKLYTIDEAYNYNLISFDDIKKLAALM